MRLLVIAMALIGSFGIARVLFTASDDREEWMRWVPSADLAALQPGERMELPWNGRRWVLQALRPSEVDAVHAVDPLRLPDPEPLDGRLIRVEIDGSTRHYTVLASKGRAPECVPTLSGTGWTDPCGCDRFDFAGRALEAGCFNLPRPAFVIDGRTFLLHPRQTAESAAALE